VPCGLLVILHLLIVIGGLLLLIIIGSGRSTRGSHAKSGQLSRSQWGIGVINGRVDGHVLELKKRLIPLTVDNLLVAPNDLNALLHHIHALICAVAHGKDTTEHLQNPGVGARGGGGTTAAGSASRSHGWRRRRRAMGPWILGNGWMKCLMCSILVELLMCHHLNHALNIGSKSTRSLRIGGNVPYLIHYVVEYIKLLMLHERIK
jgi:hypothetical protein